MHSTPIPLTLLFFFYSNTLLGCDSEKQTQIFVLISASRPGSWTPHPPVSPSPPGTHTMSGDGNYRLLRKVVDPNYHKTAGLECREQQCTRLH